MEILLLLARAFCGISFVVYNIIGFQYIEAVLSTVRLSKAKKVTMSIANSIFYLLLSSFDLSVYVVYLCGFLTLVVEFLFIYRLHLRRVIYVASTFMFNIVAVRNLVFSAAALITFQPLNQISGNSTIYNLALAISFVILDIAMVLFLREKIVTFDDLTVFSREKVQETYTAFLSALIFAYIMLFSGTHSYNTGMMNLTILNLFTPITLGGLYYTYFAYGIKMSKMFQLERHSRELEHELMQTKESKIELENIAYIDPLTNAYSRRFCIDKINELTSDGIEFALCFIDVDRLKKVNDTFGHAHGDTYLQMVADVLRTILRKDDVVARMGGDEFVVLLTQCSMNAAQSRMKIAHEKVNSLREKFFLEYDACISYGIVEVGVTTQQNADQLLAQADKLMYDFKIAQKKAQGCEPAAL